MHYLPSNQKVRCFYVVVEIDYLVFSTSFQGLKDDAGTEATARSGVVAKLNSGTYPILNMRGTCTLSHIVVVRTIQNEFPMVLKEHHYWLHFLLPAHFLPDHFLHSERCGIRVLEMIRLPEVAQKIS